MFVGGAKEARIRQHLYLQAVAQTAFAHARWHPVGVAGASGLAHLEYFPVYGFGDDCGDVQICFNGEDQPFLFAQALEAARPHREGLEGFAPARGIECLLQRPARRQSGE